MHILIKILPSFNHAALQSCKQRYASLAQLISQEKCNPNFTHKALSARFYGTNKVRKGTINRNCKEPFYRSKKCLNLPTVSTNHKSCKVLSKPMNWPKSLLDKFYIRDYTSCKKFEVYETLNNNSGFVRHQNTDQHESPWKSCSGLLPFTKRDASFLNRKEISSHMPLFKVNNLLVNYPRYPLALPKKSFSTSTTACSGNQLAKSKNCSKIDPNYDFPYLSKLFGTEDLLMRSDAYNKALLEAAKRRAALQEFTDARPALKNRCNGRPQVTNIRECDANKQNEQQYDVQLYNLCPSTKTKKQSDAFNKKDDSAKSSEYIQLGKDELGELKQEKQKKPNTIPGCEDPKQVKGDCRDNKPLKLTESNNSNNINKLKLGADKDVKVKEEKVEASGNKCNSYPGEKSKVKEQKNPCLDKDKAYIPKCNEDPCKEDKTGGAEKAPPKIGENSSNKNKPGCDKKKNAEPSKKQKKEDTCKKGNPLSKKIDEKPKDPCGKSSKKEELYKKNKEEDSNKKKDSCGSAKQKEDPCKRKEQRQNPCAKKNVSEVNKLKEDQKVGSCGSRKENPNKKETPNPCAKEQQREQGPKNSFTPKTDTRPKSQTCSKSPKETKPNCKKSFSTLAMTPNQISSYLILRSITALPSLKCGNSYKLGLVRHLSSKRGGKNKKDDFAKASQCKTVVSSTPPNRKPAYNPHPKEGLRKCYQTYDMDCKKLCKEPRETDCKKYAFLKDTDNKTRTSKK